MRKLTEVSQKDVLTTACWRVFMLRSAKRNEYVPALWGFAGYLARTYTVRAANIAQEQVVEHADRFMTLEVEALTAQEQEAIHAWVQANRDLLLPAQPTPALDKRINIASGEDAGDCWED